MHNITVVIAEDEKLLLDNLADKIDSCELGFAVIGKAQTGKDAWDLIEQHTPDLVITDIKMPVMDGLALLEKVRLYHPHTDCIITSGFSDFEYAKSAIKLQVCDYLLKPIDPDELYRVLNRIKEERNIKQEEYAAVFYPGIRTDSIASTLKEYLIHNYTIDINLNLIASGMNYSSSYLTKLFVQYYDITPSKFIINLRISSAKQLLRSTELSISQVGEAVGYHEQSYFSRIFKKQTGVSPFEFREQR